MKYLLDDEGAFSGGKTALYRLEKELKVALRIAEAGLHHPHVVQMYGYCSYPEALVQEYMGGGNMRSLLDSQDQLA